MFDFSDFNFNKFMYELSLSIVPFLFAVTVHEVMHGFVAYKLGDNTAKDAGRLTLNPIKHIDPIGLLFLLVTRMFGWAKPVPVNFYNIRHHKYGVAMVAFAGPASNIVMAILSVIAIKVLLLFQLPENIGTPIALMLVYSVRINIALTIFNLIPIMPLDGARILSNFLPRDMAIKYEATERYGMIILLILFMTNIYGKVIGPLIGGVYQVVFSFI